MGDTVEQAKDSQAAIPFQWRDRHGSFHDPKGMATRHLFYALRMIWNHGMPEAAKIHPYQAYTFEPFYSEVYMRDAIVALHRELATRNDLKREWVEQLNQMAMYFLKINSTERIAAQAELLP